MSKIAILSHTHFSFSEEIFKRLGKGKIHAGLIYEEFFRTGKIEAKDLAFANAGQLLKDILSLTDFSIPGVASELTDGQTGKFLIRTQDQLEIESVVIPMQAGLTLCVSSQIGCRMGCSFCETGRMGLLRQLSVEEIVAQVFLSIHHLKCPIRNIVFMGMGEPFDNYDAVLQACRILNDAKGFGFGRNHLTVSTSGLIQGIYRLVEEGEYAPNLAVSINAPDDSSRLKIMPITRKHAMQELYEAMKFYNTQTKRQILAAYVMIEGYNDTLEHADRLAAYLGGLDVKVNLIPYNHQTCERFKPSNEETIDAFLNRLRQNGIAVLRRLTKGKDIMAACGQLGNLQLRKNRSLA